MMVVVVFYQILQKPFIEYCCSLMLDAEHILKASRFAFVLNFQSVSYGINSYLRVRESDTSA